MSSQPPDKVPPAPPPAPRAPAKPEPPAPSVKPAQPERFVEIDGRLVPEGDLQPTQPIQTIRGLPQLDDD